MVNPFTVDPIGVGFIIISIASLFAGCIFRRPARTHNQTRRTHHDHAHDRLHHL